MDMEDYSNVMKALSDSNRVRALIALGSGELCVCQILEILELAPSTVSKHMSILKHAKLVERRKAGRWIFYRHSQKASDFIRTLTGLTLSALSDAELVKMDKKRLQAALECNLEDLCRKQRGDKCCS